VASLFTFVSCHVAVVLVQVIHVLARSSRNSPTHGLSFKTKPGAQRTLMLCVPTNLMLLTMTSSYVSTSLLLDKKFIFEQKAYNCVASVITAFMSFTYVSTGMLWAKAAKLDFSSHWRFKATVYGATALFSTASLVLAIVFKSRAGVSLCTTMLLLIVGCTFFVAARLLDQVSAREIECRPPCRWRTWGKRERCWREGTRQGWGCSMRGWSGLLHQRKTKTLKHVHGYR